MKKQDVISWRGKSAAELAAEVKRLGSALPKTEEAHEGRKLRRDLAQLKTIQREKELYESMTKHE